MAQVFIKPIGGIVRDPKTMQPLPESGMFVEYNSYWRRRIKDGSVVISKPEKKPTYQPIKKEDKE